MQASGPRRHSHRQAPSLVSVVVPIRNAEDHVGEQLAALAGQTYRGPWELLVVDNGCSDRSIQIVESFRERLPSLVVVDATPRRGLGRARNAGAAAAATGPLLAYCDADDVVARDWLAALAEAAVQTPTLSEAPCGMTSSTRICSWPGSNRSR